MWARLIAQRCRAFGLSRAVSKNVIAVSNSTAGKHTLTHCDLNLARSWSARINTISPLRFHSTRAPAKAAPRPSATNSAQLAEAHHPQSTFSSRARRKHLTTTAAAACAATPSSSSSTAAATRTAAATIVDDGMPRFPNKSTAGALRALDYFGTAVFALSGTLTAGAAGMDMLGCVTVGCITAMGGGTVRDVVLGNRPVFWMVENEYLALSAATALLTFWLWPTVSESLGLSEDDVTIRYADALGLGAFAVIGAQNGLRARVPALACIVCGMMTSTFGGVIRDVLCHKPARILHANAEVYASTAVVGAAVYVAAARVGVPLPARIVAGASSTFAMRVAAWNYDLRLPLYSNNSNSSNSSGAVSRDNSAHHQS